MTINIFGPETKDSIRVEYISPQDGLVGDVTICEANQIAKSNPGTQFVLRNRDKIKYLNINEVNNLNPKDIKSEKGCPGINLDVKCGPPKVNFYGGGGVGAKANAVIGKDGSVLAIDLVSKGYGYKYPPLVEVSDNCGLGNGAVVIAELEEQPEFEEVFGDDDLEIYQICPPTDPGYGQLYGANGKAVGSWNPRVYISSGENRAQLEIKKYQDLLEKIKNPWFTSRKNLPDRTLYPDVKYLYDNDKKQLIDTASYKFFSDQAYQITKGNFDKFLNDFGISPVPTSKYKATDYAGVPFTLEWDVDFPFDGEYTFYGLSNPEVKSEFFIDNKKEKDIPNSKGSNPLLIKKKIKKGVHKIRVDLTNQQKFNFPEQRRVLPIDLTQPRPGTRQQSTLCFASGGRPGNPLGGSSFFRQTVKEHLGKGAQLKSGGYAEPTNGVNFDGIAVGSTPTKFKDFDFFTAKYRVLLPNNSGFGYGGSGSIIGGSYGIVGSGKYSNGRIILDATPGGNGAVQIKCNGKTISYTKPGVYKFTVPGKLGGSTTLNLVCIGGGGGGYSPLGEKFAAFNFLLGSGGSGGSYSNNSISVTAGTKIRIVVGSGGNSILFRQQRTTAIGGDSYVSIEEVPVIEPTVEAKDKISAINTKSIQSITTNSTRERNIFNTRDYINKANPPLWRSNPVTSGSNNVFFNKYAVSVINPSASISDADLNKKLKHTITWKNINIPNEDLIVEVMAAGYATVSIKNKNTSFEIVQSSARRSPTTYLGEKQTNQTQSFTKKFPAGVYDIIVEMTSTLNEARKHKFAFALNIKTKSDDKLITEPKSWQENPTVIALKIDAPPAPPPPKPLSSDTNRCANNPTWSTRFTNSKSKWWIANSAGSPNEKNSWGAFMNQYAISPVAPFTISPADNGDILYGNEWEFEVTQEGYHALLATADNFGQIYIDNQLVMTSSATGGPGISPTTQRSSGGFTLPPATNNTTANANASGGSKPPKSSGPSAGAAPLSKTIIPAISLPATVVGVVTVTLPPDAKGKKPSPLPTYREYNADVLPPNVSDDRILGISTVNLNPFYYNVYGNAENKNPEVTWSFSKLPPGVSIESYRILLHDLSSTDPNKPFSAGKNRLRVHWDITVPAAITTIPAGVTDPKVIWGENSKPIIGRTYLGDDDKGVSPIGYAGPQPPVDKVHTYLLSVQANLIGSPDKISVSQYFDVGRELLGGDLLYSPRVNAILNPTVGEKKKIESRYSGNDDFVNYSNEIKFVPKEDVFKFDSSPLTLVLTSDNKTTTTSNGTDISLYTDLIGNYYDANSGIGVGIYTGTSKLKNGEALNRSPGLKWNFGVIPDDVKDDIQIQKYEVLLQCISGQDSGRIHWNFTVKPNVTEIPYNVGDDWKTSRFDFRGPEILKNYTGLEAFPFKVGITTFGYSGPQPRRTESARYRLSVTATLVGKLVVTGFEDFNRVTKSIEFDFINYDENEKPYSIIQDPSTGITPKYPDKLEVKYNPTKKLTTVKVEKFTLNVTPPQSSDKKSSTSEFINEPNKMRKNFAPIAMVGNTQRENNPNQYVNAENRNPEVQWEFELPGAAQNFVSVKEYEITLEDLSELGVQKTTEDGKLVPNVYYPRLHWNVIIPKDKQTKIPAEGDSDFSFYSTQIDGIQVRDNYLSNSANKSGINPIGYSGPQPPRNEVHWYQLTLVVSFNDSKSKLLKSIIFKYPQPATRAEYPIAYRSSKNKTLPVDYTTALTSPILQINALSAIPEVLQDPFFLPPPAPKKPDPVDFTVPTSSLLLEITPKDAEQLERINGVAPISMIGNAEVSINPYQYEGAENANPEVKWSFGTLPDGVAVTTYRVILEDISEIDETTKQPILHWDITVPVAITTIPANVTDPKVIWGEQTPVIGTTYLGEKPTSGVSPIGYAGPQPITTESHSYRISVTANLSGNLTEKSSRSITQSLIFLYNDPKKEGVVAKPTIEGSKLRIQDNITFNYTPEPEVVDDSIKTETQIVPVKSKTESKETSLDEQQKKISVKVRNYLNTKITELTKKIQTSKNDKEKEPFRLERSIISDLINAINALVLNTNTKNLSLIPIIEDRISKIKNDVKDKTKTKLPYYETILKEIRNIENPPPKPPPSSTPPKPSLSSTPSNQNQKQKSSTVTLAPLPDPKVPGRISNPKDNNPEPKKIFLKRGKHKIRVEIKNNQINKPSNVTETKIFSTKDWLVAPIAPIGPEPVKNKTGIVCHAGGGLGGLKNSLTQNSAGRVIVGKGNNGSPGLAPRDNDKTTASGGGAGLRSGRSSSSGTTLDGTESAISNIILPSGPFTGEPIRSWCAFGDKRGAIFNGGNNRYIPFNGNAFYDVKTGYGYGGSIHLKGDRGFRGDRFVYPERASGGNGAVRISFNGKTQDYTTPGTYEFVVPEGATILDLVCIGGGGSGFSQSSPRTGGGVEYLLDTLKDTGGSGGAYAYATVEVTPKTRLKIIVGAGGAYTEGGSQNGGNSYVEILDTNPNININTNQNILLFKSTSKTAPGIIYEGPTQIANYRKDFISPLLKDVNLSPNEEIQGKTWKFKWSKVNFPVNGEYILTAEADDELIVRIDNVQIAQVKLKESKDRQKIKFNTTKGIKTVELELTNGRIPNSGFNDKNPTLAFAEITRIVKDSKNVSSEYWSDNPIGISAVLIPPPCPKKIRGRGTIKPNPPVLDGGNGYKDPTPTPPTVPPTVPPAVPPAVPPTVPPAVPPTVPPTVPPAVPPAVPPTYPVILIPTLIIGDPGINYNCAEDQIFVNDISVPFECDTFGRITNIDLKTVPPVVEYPTIRVQTETGIGLDFNIQFQVIRDPVDVAPQQLLQVTDLVGLKQTGYINGRPYYGSVFYENGIPYAGLYKTPGPLIQVYNTLRESIDAQVTTPPSAILRSGTDISNNNPRLNIPGTPENLV